MKILILLLLVLLSFPVSAETTAKKEVKETAFCKLLPSYKPVDDVVYKAGVDVHGNAVVPADLNDAPIILPEVIKIPLQIDLAKRLDNLDGFGLDADAPLGLVEIHQDGRVVYEGKDITVQSTILCGRSHKVENKESENRQGATNPIQSEPVKYTKE